MDPRSFYGLAGIPVVLALVQVIKVGLPGVDGRVWPAVTLGVAVGFNVGLAALIGSDPGLAALVGLVTGLSASGLYSQGKVLGAGLRVLAPTPIPENPGPGSQNPAPGGANGERT
jgi:hypothetical protein